MNEHKRRLLLVAVVVLLLILVWKGRKSRRRRRSEGRRRQWKMVICFVTFFLVFLLLLDHLHDRGVLPPPFFALCRPRSSSSILLDILQKFVIAQVPCSELGNNLCCWCWVDLDEDLVNCREDPDKFFNIWKWVSVLEAFTCLWVWRIFRDLKLANGCEGGRHHHLACVFC